VIFSVGFAVTISVIMRNIGLRGIAGDFEMVQMSCAFAAGLFLPLCQLKRGHVMVDIFTSWLPASVNGALDRIWSLLFALSWGALAVFTLHGMQEIRAYGDKTMLLQIPVWWAFVPAILGSALSCIIGLAQTFFWRDGTTVSVEH